MKLFNIQKIIDFVRNYLDYVDKTKVKIYYIGKAKHHNAGDMLNEHIMNYFNIKFKKVRATNANLFCVGSILNSIVVSPSKKNQMNKECNIIGAGLSEIPQEIEVLAKKMNIYALRGNLTKEILERLSQTKISCTLADPGLLLSHIYPCDNKDKIYKVGIIPHFEDKGDFLLNNIQLEKYSWKIIDIEADIEKFVQDINSCECILSSSLHGLIFSDSFNIPNRQIILSKRKGLFKYQDYYSSYDLELLHIYDLNSEIITDAEIDTILNEYVIKKCDVKNKQQSLIKAFEDYKQAL